MHRRELLTGCGMALGAAGLLAVPAPAAAKCRPPANRDARAAIAAARRAVKGQIQDYNRSLTNLRKQTTTIDVESFIRSLGLTGISLGQGVLERIAQAVSEVLQVLQDVGRIGAPSDDLTRALNQLVEIVLCAQGDASEALRTFEGLQVQGTALRPGIMLNPAAPYGDYLNGAFNAPQVRIDVVSTVNNLLNLRGRAPAGAPVNVTAFGDQGEFELVFRTANAQGVWGIEGVTLSRPPSPVRLFSTWCFSANSPGIPLGDRAFANLVDTLGP